MSKISLKTGYSIVIVLAILYIPIIDNYEVHYGVSSFGYAIGFLMVPIIFGGIARSVKASFQNTFNITGTIIFVSSIVQQFLN